MKALGANGLGSLCCWLGLLILRSFLFKWLAVKQEHLCVRERGVMLWGHSDTTPFKVNWNVFDSDPTRLKFFGFLKRELAGLKAKYGLVSWHESTLMSLHHQPIWISRLTQSVKAKPPLVVTTVVSSLVEVAKSH